MNRPIDLRTRTRDYSLAAIRLYSRLPRARPAQMLGRQVLSSVTSVGAQYREAGRAKSAADFVSKCEGALQELDETAYWLDLIEGAGIANSEAIASLRDETEQLIAIFVTIIRNAKQKQGRAVANSAF
jgi:four helix bundle protein